MEWPSIFRKHFIKSELAPPQKPQGNAAKPAVMCIARHLEGDCDGHLFGNGLYCSCTTAPCIFSGGRRWSQPSRGEAANLSCVVTAPAFVSRPDRSSPRSFIHQNTQHCYKIWRKKTSGRQMTWIIYNNINYVICDLYSSGAVVDSINIEKLHYIENVVSLSVLRLKWL